MSARRDRLQSSPTIRPLCLCPHTITRTHLTHRRLLDKGRWWWRTWTHTKSRNSVVMQWRLIESFGKAVKWSHSCINAILLANGRSVEWSGTCTHAIPRGNVALAVDWWESLTEHTTEPKRSSTPDKCRAVQIAPYHLPTIYSVHFTISAWWQQVVYLVFVEQFLLFQMAILHMWYHILTSLRELYWTMPTLFSMHVYHIIFIRILAV